MKRFRCSIAVFLCWAFIVAASVAFYILIFVIPLHRIELDIGFRASWYLRRGDWQAMPAYKREFLPIPVKYVIIAHTELKTHYCDEKYSCIENVINLQQSQMKDGDPDIDGNYLVGGNGWIFEGRGADVRSSFMLGWENMSITVSFIGNYDINKPDQAQLNHVSLLLNVLVSKGVLRKDYVIYGYCQIYDHIISPGPNIMEKLHCFPHWNSENATTCLPGGTDFNKILENKLENSTCLV